MNLLFYLNTDKANICLEDVYKQPVELQSYILSKGLGINGGLYAFTEATRSMT